MRVFTSRITGDFFWSAPTRPSCTVAGCGDDHPMMIKSTIELIRRDFFWDIVIHAKHKWNRFLAYRLVVMIHSAACSQCVFTGKCRRHAGARGGGVTYVSLCHHIMKRHQTNDIFPSCTRQEAVPAGGGKGLDWRNK